MPTVITIEDPGDARLEPYRAVRERDLARREGLYVAEGRVVLEKAVQADPAALVSALIAAHRVESLAGILSRLPPGTPVYAAGQAVMDRVVGFPMHRGVLALARRPALDAHELIARLPANAVVVGLVGIANHDNMGGLFRNAAAFGADAVLLDDSCCDPLYRKAIRVSVGAALTTPFARAGGADRLVTLLEAAGFAVAALSPRGDIELPALDLGRRAAVLFGAEGPGLPDEILRRMRSVRIAMAEGFDSLNVATAAGVVLHHLWVCRMAAA